MLCSVFLKARQTLKARVGNFDTWARGCCRSVGEVAVERMVLRDVCAGAGSGEREYGEIV